MKILVLLLVIATLILSQSCTTGCADAIPQYCQLIDYDPNYYEPVCGCDGKTYTNVAVAECQFGILDHFPGECD